MVLKLRCFYGEMESFLQSPTMDRRPRIKESCDEMANDDILRRDGVLARITGFDEGRTAYYAVMPNGHSTQLTFPSQEIFDIGDVLLVGKDFYTRCRPRCGRSSRVSA